MARATGKVLVLLVVVNISGQMKLFQEPRKVNMAKAVKAGLQRGNTTLAKMPISEQPSILAASIKTLGIVLMYSRIKKMPKALAHPGMIKAR